MSYRILDLDVTQPLPCLTLLGRETGVAGVIRRREQPIGFLMRSLPPRSVISAQRLSHWITQECGLRLLQSALQESLLASDAPPPGDRLPPVTIALCTRDRPEWAMRCVRSLLSLRLPENHNGVEILVVDNAPGDERTCDLVSAMDGVRYLREPKAGLNFARNRALQAAHGDLLAFVDDDVVVDPGWLLALWRSWWTHPDAAAWTGQVLPYELETEAQILFEQRGGFRRAFEPIRFGAVLPENPLYPSAVGICGTGCNMVFRRDVLQHLNGFDEALDTGKPLPGGGDHDIFYRVVRAGYPLIYEPGCLVFHHHRRDRAQLRRQYWSWGLAIMAFLGKCHQQDPEMRSQVRSLMRWWFQDELRQVWCSLCGRHPLPADLLLGELWGGVRGLLGEYGRSQSRVAQIRRAVELVPASLERCNP